MKPCENNDWMKMMKMMKIDEKSDGDERYQ